MPRPLIYLKGIPSARATIQAVDHCRTAAMPFLTHGSYRIRYELDGPENGAGLCARQRAHTICRAVGGLSRRAGGAGNFASPPSTCSARARPTSPALFISQDDQVAALGLLIDQLGDGPGLPQRDQLRRTDRAALRDRAWRPARRAGADELLCRALAAAAAARQRLAHRADPRRHRLSAGSAAADEPVRCMAEAAARTTSKRSSGRAGWSTTSTPCRT